MQKIYTENAPKAIGPYSQAIEANGLIYLSGQIPIDPQSNSIKANDILGQTQQVIQNIREILKAAGSSISNVLKTTCYLKNMSDFAVFNEEYEKHFTGKPARVCIEVSALPKGSLVEIDAIALKNNV